MATSTFDRKIEIKNPEAIRNLASIIASDPPKEPFSKHPYGQAEREKSNALLKQWLKRMGKQVGKDYRTICHYSRRDEAYISFTPDYPGCIADGETPEEANRELDTIVKLWLEIVEENKKRGNYDKKRERGVGSSHERMDKTT